MLTHQGTLFYSFAFDGQTVTRKWANPKGSKKLGLYCLTHDEKSGEERSSPLLFAIIQLRDQISNTADWARRHRS